MSPLTEDCPLSRAMQKMTLFQAGTPELVYCHIEADLAAALRKEALIKRGMRSSAGASIGNEIQSRTALALFFHITDSNRAVAKAEANQLFVTGMEVNMTLHYHSISNDHKCDNFPQPPQRRVVDKKPVVPLRPVRSFEYQPKVENEIIKFVRNFPVLVDQLKTEFKNLADIEFKEKSTGENNPNVSLSIKPALDTMPSEYKCNQVKFREKCSDVILKFMNKFASISATFDDKNLANLRRCNSWNNDTDFVRVEIKHNVFADVYVRWNDLRLGHVTVTGWQDEVIGVLQLIKQKSNIDFVGNSIPKLVAEFERAMRNVSDPPSSTSSQTLNTKTISSSGPWQRPSSSRQRPSSSRHCPSGSRQSNDVRRSGSLLLPKSIFSPEFSCAVDTKPVVPLRPVRSFEYQPKVENEIIKFVRNFPVLVDQLKTEFKNLADIEFKEKSTGENKTNVSLFIKPALDTMPSEYKHNQVKFREKCSNLILKFMDKFASTSATFDDKSLANLRRCNSWNNDVDFIRVEIKHNVFADVYVRWNDLRLGHVTVTGWQDEVIGVLQLIKQKSNIDFVGNSIPKLVAEFERAMRNVSDPPSSTSSQTLNTKTISSSGPWQRPSSSRQRPSSSRQSNDVRRSGSLLLPKSIFSPEFSCAVDTKPVVPLRPVRSFEYQPKVENEIIKFVRNFPVLVDQLKTEFKNLADIEFKEKSTGENNPNVFLSIKPALDTMPSEYKHNQVKLREKCSNLILKFMDKFASKSATFDDKNLANLRRCNSWNNDSDFICVEIKHNVFADVYVRWNDLRLGHVTVTGWQDEVIGVLQLIKQKSNIDFVGNSIPKLVAEFERAMRNVSDPPSSTSSQTLNTKTISSSGPWQRPSSSRQRPSSSRQSNDVRRSGSLLLPKSIFSPEFSCAVDTKPVVPLRPVRSFEYQPKVENEIIKFVRNFPVLVDQLKTEFKNLADIEFKEKSTGENNPNVFLSIKPALDTMPSEYKHNQVKLREKCSNLILKFMDKFASKSATFDDKNLANLRRCNSWNNDSDFICVEIKHNVFADVYVRWNDLRLGHVTVTGWQDEVIGVLQLIKQKSNIDFVGNSIPKLVAEFERAMRNVSDPPSSTSSQTLNTKTISSSGPWQRPSSSRQRPSSSRQSNDVRRSGSLLLPKSIFSPEFSCAVDTKPVVPLRPVRSFEYQPKVENEIIKFVRNFPVLVDQLKTEFKNLADIEFKEKSTGENNPNVFLSIKPALDTMPSEYKHNQVKLREKCSNLILKFMDKFASKSATFDDKNLANLRRCNSWNNDSDFICVEIKHNVFADVYVRWNDLRLGHVTVTGWQDEVIGVLQLIKQKSNVCDNKKVFDQSSFRPMRECKVFDEVKKSSFKNTVSIEDASENFTICFKGPRNSVAGERVQKTDNKMKLTTGVMPDLGEVSKYLLTSLQNCESRPDMIDVRQILQAKFDEKKIQASLQLIDDQVCVLYMKQSEMERAQKALLEMIKHQTLHVRKGIDELVSSAEWKRLRKIICKSGSVQVFVDKGNSNIIVVGLTRTFEKSLYLIKEHIKVNATITSTIRERYVVVKYFKKFKDVFGEDGKASLKEVEIEWRTAHDKPPEVAITGKLANVEAASYWIQNAIARFSVATCKFADHGIPEYFRSKDGTDSLNAIGERRHCMVLVDPPEWQTSAPRGSATPRNFGPVAKLTVLVPRTGVTLRLIQTDITESHCDAIVNAANEDLELRPAGVSGCILSKGGYVVQKEMISHVSSAGKLRAGQVISTSAGKLGFKRIIHAVGPKWSTDTECEYQRDLKKCVTNSLLEASKHGLKSIALPAISCGVFGGKPSSNVPILVKAVVDYVREYKDCNVTQIDFVENSNSKIVDEFERAMKNVSEPPSSIPSQTLKLKTIPPSGSWQSNDVRRSGSHLSRKSVFSTPFAAMKTAHAWYDLLQKNDKLLPKSRFIFRPMLTFPSSPTAPAATAPTLSVRIADISTLTSQVIVTSSTPSNMQSGQVTAVSKALYGRAGPQLQKACMLAGSEGLQIGDVISTSGFNLSCREVYHVMLIKYDPNLRSRFLNTIIQKCLSDADSSGYASIAFPILGAGGFGYPPDLVARTLKRVVANFRASYLRTVTLVVYPFDQAALQAVQPELDCSSSSQDFSNKQFTAPKWKNVRVSVNNGDLLALPCDVIVNSTVNFDLSGQVGKVICAQGGQSIAAECARNPVRSSATYRVTHGGNLSCKYIVHVNTPNDPNQLRDAIVGVLKVAEQLQMSSIGFPAIGTGNIGMQSRDAAKSIGKAIKDFDQSNPRYLRTIHVCVFQQQMLSDFQQHILGSQQQSSFFDAFKARLGFGKTKALKPSLPSLLPTAESRKSQVSVSILLCSYQKENVTEVMQNVQNKVKELSRVMFIEDEALKDLTHSEEHELLVICEKHKVLIERVQKDGAVSLSIRGLTNPVLEAYTASLAVVHQFKEALLCAEYVKWKYKDRRSGKMTDFPLRANNELEKSYKKNNNGNVVVDIYINGTTHKFRVDFASKKETCLRTNQVTKVERRAKAADDPLPSHWDDMVGQSFKLVPLINTSADYAPAMQRFYQSLALTSVVKLERIQNPTLYKQFQAQKKKVQSRMASGTWVTRQLFHGTSGDVCDKICKDGFDRSYAGKHATAYGKGVYFATTASYSNTYTEPDGQGRRRMFLADVITGHYCKGSSSMKTIPMQANGTPFDSLVDNTQNPSMFVVFKDTSVYPSYILTYI